MKWLWALFRSEPVEAAHRFTNSVTFIGRNHTASARDVTLGRPEMVQVLRTVAVMGFAGVVAAASGIIVTTPMRSRY